VLNRLAILWKARDILATALSSPSLSTQTRKHEYWSWVKRTLTHPLQDNECRPVVAFWVLTRWSAAQGLNYTDFEERISIETAEKIARSILRRKTNQPHTERMHVFYDLAETVILALNVWRRREADRAREAELAAQHRADRGKRNAELARREDERAKRKTKHNKKAEKRRAAAHRDEMPGALQIALQGILQNGRLPKSAVMPAPAARPVNQYSADQAVT
jgi:hypothetical protein